MFHSYLLNLWVHSCLLEHCVTVLLHFVILYLAFSVRQIFVLSLPPFFLAHQDNFDTVALHFSWLPQPSFAPLLVFSLFVPLLLIGRRLFLVPLTFSFPLPFVQQLTFLLQVFSTFHFLFVKSFPLLSSSFPIPFLSFCFPPQFSSFLTFLPHAF